jgi:hypothetical protein
VSTYFISLKWLFLLPLFLSISTTAFSRISSSCYFLLRRLLILLWYSSFWLSTNRYPSNNFLKFRSSILSLSANRRDGLSFLPDRKFRRSALSLFDKMFATTGMFCLPPREVPMRPLLLGSGT